MVFQNFCLKLPKKDILIPNLRILIFHETKSLDKLEDVDYKYDISFLTFLARSSQNGAFLVQIMFFLFVLDETFSQIRGC